MFNFKTFGLQARKFNDAQPEKVQKSTDCTFLDPSISYSLPPYTFNRFKNTVALTLHTKNVEPDSIELQKDSSTIHLKFLTIGAGFFPTYYAFYFAIAADVGVIKNVNAEAWDNNVIVQIEFDQLSALNNYQVGLTKYDCKEFTCTSSGTLHETVSKQKDDLKSDDENIEIKVDEVSSDELCIEIVNKGHAQNNNNNSENKSKKARKGCKKNRSFSESHCDELKAAEENTFDGNINNSVTSGNENQLTLCPIHSAKPRTYSESSNDDLHHNSESFQLKSILKRRSSYRSASECSGDEQAYSCSVDLGVGSFTSIPEERGVVVDRDRQPSEISESVRKTVRFDKHLCRKLLFRWV